MRRRDHLRVKESRIDRGVRRRRIDAIARHAVVAVELGRDVGIGHEDVRLFDDADHHGRLKRRANGDEAALRCGVVPQFAEHLMVVRDVDESVGGRARRCREVLLGGRRCLARRETDRSARTKELIGIGVRRVERTREHALTRMFGVNLEEIRTVWEELERDVCLP